MRALLLCRVRSGETRAFDLEGGDALIGREDGLAVSLPFEEVSRQHAKISWDGKSHWLEDLESTNGTFLNGRRLLKEREKLRHLSVVTLGAQTDLVFVVRPEETETLRRSVIQHAFLVRDAPDALPYDVPVGELTVGRSAGCNIVSDSPEVSKLHARLLRAADKLTVRDLGSANGTWVNGVRVSEAPLLDGDLLAFAGERYRVSVAMGEITSSTVSALRAEEVLAAREAKPGEQETPRFSTDWKHRVEGLEQPSGPLDVADETSRGSAQTDQTLYPSAPGASSAGQPQTEPIGVAAGRIEVRLTGADVDLAVTGGGSYVLGSGRGASVRLQHRSVSEAHARLIVSDVLGSVFIQGEGGRTLRNGEKVEKTEPLLDGDVVCLGDLELRVAIRRVD